MVIGRRHALEVNDADATLVLSEIVSRRELTAIRRQCRELPAHIRTLHLDLAAVTQFDGGVLDAVRGVVRDWRRSREGGYRLDFVSPLLVARVEKRGEGSTVVPAH